MKNTDHIWNKIGKPILIVVYLILLYLVVFLFDHWFDAKLYRHIAGQFPLVILLGWLSGYFLWWKYIGSDSVGIHLSVIVFFMGSLVYWMLPVSIDQAAINNNVDLILSINLWLAGALLGSQFRNMAPELKSAFLLLLPVMIIITGVVLKQINLLLCGAYTLYQQKVLGSYLFTGGLWILALAILWIGVMLWQENKNFVFQDRLEG